MGIRQPPVAPLPRDIDLKGSTIVVTGASAGMGLETARQLLAHGASRVILAVRNVKKGERCAEMLLQEPEVKEANPQGVVTVMELDMERFDSVNTFAKQMRIECTSIDLLILNAGIGILTYEVTSDKHERTLQVNYLSNVLLIFNLLPILENGSVKLGKASRITWIGSRTHHNSTLAKNAPVLPGESIIEHFDNPRFFYPFKRYNDTKLLCAMFMYELAPRLDSGKVVLNMLCPGMVNTSMSDVLPIYLRMPINIVKAIRARTVEEGSWIIMNSAVVAGKESHGRFLLDKVIESIDKFASSSDGQIVQRKLWDDTMKEMSHHTSLPAFLLQACP